MAFKLAEAFVELKAKGHAEVVKETEKVKEKTKEIGPVADEAAKRIDRACVSMNASFDKSKAKVADFERDFRTKMDAVKRKIEEVEKEEAKIGGGGVLGGSSATRFGGMGRLAGSAASAIGIASIARAAVNRGQDLAEGGTSETLGQHFTKPVADFARGLGEMVSQIKTGFVDGLLGLVSYAADYLTFGVFSKLGAAMAEEERRKNDDRRQHNDVRAFVDQERASGARLGDFDARMELRNRLNFNGGKESLEAERADLARTNAGGNIERIRMIDDELLALKQRELQAAKKSTSLNEELGDAVAEMVEAAKLDALQRMKNVAAMEGIGKSELASQKGISRVRQQFNAMVERMGNNLSDPEITAKLDASDRVHDIELHDANAAVDKAIDQADKKNQEDIERKRQNARGREFDRELRDQLNQPMASISQMGIADLQSALQQGEIAKANEELRRQNQDIADKANDKRDEIVKGTANIVDAVKKITGAVFQ